jgi:phage/plasmid-associated DNA primase
MSPASWARDSLPLLRLARHSNLTSPGSRLLPGATPSPLDSYTPGILNWAIQGCLDWQTNGLHIPEAVTRATKEYQDENNVLVEFFDDCCFLEPEAWASSSDLFGAYFDWSKKREEKFPIERTAFGSRLAKMGRLHAKKAGKEGTRGWAGIRLKTDIASDPTTSFFIHKAP